MSDPGSHESADPTATPGGVYDAENNAPVDDTEDDTNADEEATE